MDSTYTRPNTATSSSREAALRGLAIVGFIALVAAGIWLAIYSARYVPSTVGRLGAAATSLSGIFTPGNPTNLSVVPNGSTTIPFVDGTTTPTKTITSSGTTGSPAIAPTPGDETSNTYQIGTTTSSVGLHGLPDLATSISAVGYLATSSASSFVVASTTPLGMRPAIKFVIQNIGTNIAQSGWTFSAILPTNGTYFFQSQPQQALNPGDSIEYTLGFDQFSPGTLTISINANSENTVLESNTANNNVSATIVVQ